MADVAHTDWRALGEAVARLLSAVQQTRTEAISSSAIRNPALEAVQMYFRSVRPELLRLGLTEPDLASLDTTLQDLNTLALARSRRTSYIRELKALKSRLGTLSIERDKRIGNAAAATTTNQQLTPTQANILATLDRMIPSAALSYRQALVDIADIRRQSFRGPAAELREAMREVVDKLAPDEDVMAADGFKLEKDRTGPTIRQKVQFILKSRRSSRPVQDTLKDTITRVEAGADGLARSLYSRGSLSTHVSTSRTEVRNLLRYIEAILAELLEIE